MHQSHWARALLVNLLTQNDEFNYVTKRATKKQESFLCDEIQFMDIY